jgi:GDPmannose 4,6-dehydratase
VKAGIQSSVQLGNLDSMRDWGYSPEYMDGLLRIAERGSSPAYVLATGYLASVRDFAFAAAMHAGLPMSIFETSAAQQRVNDVTWLHGNSRLAKEELDWQAGTHWLALCHLMVDNDLKNIGYVGIGVTGD